MKKTKRTLALIGAILLVLLYLSTLIFAIIGSPTCMELLRASVAATIILPVLLYGYSLVYRLSKKNKDNEEDL